MGDMLFMVMDQRHAARELLAKAFTVPKRSDIIDGCSHPRQCSKVQRARFDPVGSLRQLRPESVGRNVVQQSGTAVQHTDVGTVKLVGGA